jgi:hypothetical protein
MTISAERLGLSAYKNGVDQVKVYKPGNLPEWLYKHHPYMTEGSKGFGWYCWKPFIISDYINKMNAGDVLIYADAGQTLVESVKPVVDVIDNDVFLFSNGWNNIDWCKMDTASAIIPEYVRNSQWDYKQTQASLIFFRVSEYSRNFCREWLAWSLMPGLIDNEPSKLPNFKTFAEHRWDQSILGCMAIKHSIPLHWFPTLTAMHLDKGNDTYPAIVDHHRKRNDEW